MTSTDNTQEPDVEGILEQLRKDVINNHTDNQLWADEDNKLFAEAKQSLNQLILKARMDESKLYEDWFNNDSTTHIEDFIEDRIAQLSSNLKRTSGGGDE